MLKQTRALGFSCAIGFVALLLVAGCGMNQSDSALVVTSVPPMSVAIQSTLAPAQFVDTGTQNQSGTGVPSSSQQRVVLKNAILNMTVDNPAASVTSITQMAEQMGGWVVASNSTATERDGQRIAQATISVRVPAEQFSSTLERIKAGAVSVDSETITGDDVTQKYVDLSSQLSNLEATEAQFQKIMSTANNINDVLTVQKQLTDVQGQIEGIKGQLKYFSEAAAYSLISLTLTQTTPVQIPFATLAPKPLGLANWQPVQIAQNAVDTMISATEVAISILIWLIIVGVPLAIPVIIVLYLVRRFRPRTVSKQPQVQAD